jgi:hypothetical protein
LLETVSGKQTDMAGNDATGAYHCSWSNTYTIDANGDYTVSAQADITHLASGASVGNTATNTGSFAPGTVLYIRDLGGSDFHTQYFETEIDDAVILAAYSTQDYAKGLSYIRAFERSMQDHTPPTYCSRIP